VTNAQAALRLLAASTPDLQEVRAALTDIISDSGRAAEVLRRLRRLLKKDRSEYLPLDINDGVLDVVRLIRSDAAERQIALDVLLAPDLPRAVGDRIQLQQVTLNLLLNAFETVKALEVEAKRVVVRTAHQDGRVIVSVSDFGVGLTDDQIAQAFEPFYTTKVDGMGLGLSICQMILSAHEGAIAAERNKDRGMTFSFSLAAVAGAATLEGALTGTHG
jgi:C4-dicarboxylate-specific signal transduction histidine kinase